MRQARLKDKSNVIRIISKTFDTNPSVNVVIGKEGDRERKLQRLAAYTFVKALNRNGAYLSDNRKGAALFYRSDQGGFFWNEQWLEVQFALTLSVKGVLNALKREGYLKKHRYAGLHYYFWFLGVEAGGGGAGFELKEVVFGKAKEDGLPVLLETSVWRNVVAYQRYGFEIYHEWKDEENGITVWFMKRDK
ncbi:hypothetical protein [Marinoscillum sp. MHG1-6]|uniref:hypothetical protein n=1 Tax=Marinoscillum sp. MHG1-6 TaxID=2959627 RepID=UPI002158287D|nr:hypothetical protein [Marinoscillum sp. MHG1-6]